jgi:hypothetical protein
MKTTPPELPTPVAILKLSTVASLAALKRTTEPVPAAIASLNRAVRLADAFGVTVLSAGVRVITAGGVWSDEPAVGKQPTSSLTTEILISFALTDIVCNSHVANTTLVLLSFTVTVVAETIALQVTNIIATTKADGDLFINNSLWKT